MSLRESQIEAAQKLGLISVLRTSDRVLLFLDIRYCKCGEGGRGWIVHDKTCPIYRFGINDHQNAEEVLKEIAPGIHWRLV